MRLLCLLLTATSASAAGMDIDAPGFWSKSYPIPRTYCEISLTLESPRVEKLLDASAPCEFIARTGGILSECRLPKEEAQRIVAELRRIGALTAYSQTCDAAPEYPELYYKRDNLQREWAEVGIHNDGAIAGLMAAQFSMLDQLISKYEAASVAALTIVINTAEPNPPLIGKTDGRHAHVATNVARKAERAIPVAGATPLAVAWARRSRAACEQIDVVTITYENGPAPENDKRLALMHSFGAAYSDPSCRYFNDSGLGVAFISTLYEARIRKVLIEQPGFKSWTVAPLNGNDGVVPDDRRFDRLSAELVEQTETLARAPHIRGLVTAEIERVRDNAQMLQILRQGRLLWLRFQ